MGDIEIWAYVLALFTINPLVGAIICAKLDKHGEFSGWLSKDPTGGLFTYLFLMVWPFFAWRIYKYYKGE